MRKLGAVVLHLVLATCCFGQEIFSVKRCGKLAVARERHGSFFYKDRLYVLGGRTPTEWTNSVQSAPVDEKGDVGSWRDEAALPDRRNYLNDAVQVVGSFVYVIGGNISDSPDPLTKLHRAKQCLWAAIQPDGSIGKWNKGPEFPAAMNGVVCLSTIADDHHLLITGGSYEKALAKEVYICDLAADGAPGNWRVLGPLPSSLWYNGTALIGGRIYLYGGLTKRERSNVNPAVYSAAYNGASLSAWRKEPEEMPSPIYSSIFCSTLKCLLAIGGRYANDYGTTAIWYAPVVDGAVQKWQMVKSDMPANVYISGAVDYAANRCFITGGQFQTVPKENAPAHDEVCAFLLPGQ
jgi:hypothetical protein